jgi:hypothetical protein
MLAGLPLATAYLDDIVVVSYNPYEHRRHMLYSIESTNVGFVCTSGSPSSHQSNIGFVVDKDGRRPDPQKISAVADMPASTITTLGSLGLVTYYKSFDPNMRAIRQPLDNLGKEANGNGQPAVRKHLRVLKALLGPPYPLTHRSM